MNDDDKLKKLSQMAFFWPHNAIKSFSAGVRPGPRSQTPLSDGKGTSPAILHSSMSFLFDFHSRKQNITFYGSHKHLNINTALLSGSVDQAL